MARITTAGTLPAMGTPVRGLPAWRLIGVCAVALTTANCAGNTQKFASGGSSSDIDPKYGVRASKRLYSEGETIPKGGGRRFSGKPYVVAGKTYVPREDARGYVREGLASWYGSAFHGRMTANGEVFDRHSIAAAHPTLPLPSYARVTNLENGYSMVVRVNDRGPYHAGRVMDVSEETARALEFHRRGTAHVRVEYVGKASTAGSDDRKLLATLRTDGHPAGRAAPVMVADLGPETEPSPERFAKASRPALAFKPAQEQDADVAMEAAEAPAPRPRRPAAVLVASAASVTVPAAVQPTAPRAASFRPAPVAVASHDARSAPLSLSPPPIRLASAEPERAVRPAAAFGTIRTAQAVPAPGPSSGRPGQGRAPEPGQEKAGPAKPSPARTSPGGTWGPGRNGQVVRTAMSSAAMPSEAKLAMARLAAASAAPVKPGAKRAHVAGVY